MASSAGRDGPCPWGRHVDWVLHAPPGLSMLTPVEDLSFGEVDNGQGAAWQDAGAMACAGAVMEGQMAQTIPGGPVVLWCEIKPVPAKQAEVMQALSGCYDGIRPQLYHFPTPARFTRWLFEQPRGDVNPWALLVVGWREAKPSAMALGAARTGDTSSLRPDARRPQLLPITGNPANKVHTAIESMIIVLEKPEHEDRVLQWAQDAGRTTASLDIHVVTDQASLDNVAESIIAARNAEVPFTPPVGRVTLSL